MFEIENNADTITNAYGCIVTMDANAGTISTGYQFYASYSVSGGATVSNRRGIYLYGCTASYMEGDLTVTGTVTSGSDIKLKENVETLENSLEKVCNLRGVSFNRKDIEGNPKQIGLIAQEVEEVIPEVVSQTADVDEDGEETGEFTKGISYANLTAVLIEAVKEQNKIIKTLTERIETLEKK